MSTITVSEEPFKLWCCVRGSVFEINIERGNYVSELKKAIKERSIPRFDQLASYELKLLKLKKPVDDEHISDIQNFTLQDKKKEDDNVILMEDMRTIGFYWPDKNPSVNRIHVIVEAPEKRSASPSGEQRESKKGKFIDPNFSNICDLVKHIRNSSTPIFDQNRIDNIIKHPEDKMLAVIEKPAIYVRESYEDLYHIITDKVSKGSDHKLIVTGTSGIGKSCFLIYMLIRLLCELRNATVIFQPLNSIDFYCFRCFWDVELNYGSYDDFSTYLGSPETWYLADGTLSPKLVRAKSVVALSPKGVVANEFQNYEKQVVLRLNMPPWSLEELASCREYVFTDVPRAIMLALYGKAGGVPRYIFQRAVKSLQYLDPETQEDVVKKESTVEKDSLDRIERALKEIDDFDKLVSCFAENAYFIKYSSRLVYRWPNDYSYVDYHLRWASRYIYKEIERKLENKSWKDLLEKMRTMKNYPSARGIMFEMYVIHLFQSNSDSFDMRELLKVRGSPQQKIFSIKQLPTIRNIRTANEISQYKNDDILILPDISNLGAADLLYTPDMIFQVTVSEDHPIKQVELVKIVENMPAYKKNNPINLVFVVPDDIYNNFKYQNIVTKDPVTKRFRNVINLNSKLKNLQQWVLKVDISKPPVFAKTGETLRSDSSVGQYNSRPRDNKNAPHPSPHLTPSQPVPPKAEFKKSNLLGAAKTKSKSRETLGSDFKSEESNFKSGSPSTSSSKVESNLLGAAKTKSKSRSGDVPLPKSEVNPHTIPDSEFSSKKSSKQKRKKKKEKRKKKKEKRKKKKEKRKKKKEKRKKKKTKAYVE